MFRPCCLCRGPHFCPCCCCHRFSSHLRSVRLRGALPYPSTASSPCCAGALAASSFSAARAHGRTSQVSPQEESTHFLGAEFSFLFFFSGCSRPFPALSPSPSRCVDGLAPRSIYITTANIAPRNRPPPYDKRSCATRARILQQLNEEANQ